MFYLKAHLHNEQNALCLLFFTDPPCQKKKKYFPSGADTGIYSEHSSLVVSSSDTRRHFAYP